jgi:DNA-binding NarL/FixJ family response regulator
MDRNHFCIPADLDKVLYGFKTLTRREHEVLNQVVWGRRNREIASELGLAIRTVKEYRGRIMKKMEANSFAERITMIVTVRLMKPGGACSSFARSTGDKDLIAE